MSQTLAFSNRNGFSEESRGGANPQFGSAQFRFRLIGDFASDQLEVRAFADDLDPFAYVVDGQPQALDLAPWQALVTPVVVY